MAQLFTFLSILALVAAVAIQVFTFSRRRPVKPVAIVLGQAASFVSMVTFSIVMMRPPGPCTWVGLLLVGVAGGLAYGGLVKVERTPAGVVMSYTLPWLVVWGSLLAMTQGLALLTGRVPWVVYSLAVLNMAVNLGMNGRVIARHRRLVSAGVVAALVLGAVTVTAVLGAPDTQLASAIESVYTSRQGSIATVEEIPDAFAPLRDSFTMVDPEEDQFVFTYNIGLSYGGRDIVTARFSTPEGLFVLVDVYRSPAEAAAEWEQYNWQQSNYHALGGSTIVQTDEDTGSSDVVADVSQAIDPEAVYALFDGGTAAPDAPPAGEVPADGGVTGEVPADGGATGEVPEGAPESVVPTGEFEDPSEYNPPVSATHLAAGTGIANTILLIGSLGQFLLTRLGQGPIGPGGPPQAPTGPPLGMPPAMPEASPQPPPAPDGKVWYPAPWDEGGAVPMDAAEVQRIEALRSAGYRWSKTDGWVTPEQGAEYEATRTRQRAIERAESDAAAKYFHDRIQAARDAQAAAAREQRNWNRRWGIHLEMRAAEEAHADAMREAVSADRAARAWGVAGMAGEVAATGLGIVGGPLGIAVRAGYRVAKGAAGGLGTALADEAGWGQTTKRVYLGTVRGAVDAGKEMAFDGAVRWAFGMPPMFPKTPAPPVVPPELLVPKAALKQALGEAAKVAETKGVAAAVKLVDPAKVVKLYQNGGMARLGALEQAGAISTAEAQVIRKVLGNEVNAAVTQGAKDAVKEFGTRTGVGVREVLIGDSGSSAAGKVGSVITDADRTVVAVFKPDKLAEYAAAHRISPAEAAKRLNAELTAVVENKVGSNLAQRGLTAEDVGFKGYSGFGAKAGPADSYGAGFTRARQSIQGDTLVVRADGTAYRAGRDTILDAEALAAKATGGPLPPAQPTVPLSEFNQLGGQQIKSLVEHTDPKSVAKAMDRIAYLAGRSGVRVDPTVAAAARAVQKNPQRVAETLESFGLTPQTFRERSMMAADRFMSGLEREFR